MNLKVLFGLALVMQLNGYAQTTPFREPDPLKGAVRTVSAEISRLSSGERRELGRLKVGTTYYNHRGNPTKRTIYSDYGFYVGKETSIYHLNGILHKQFFHDAQGTLMTTKVYSHDVTGKISRINTFDEKGRISLTQSYKYDSEDNSFKETIQNSTGTIGEKVLKLDSKGNITEVAYYDSHSALMEKWLYGYDGDTQNVAWEALYNADGSLRKKLVHLHELDSQGNWIKRFTTVATINQLGSGDESIFITYRSIRYY